MFTADMLRPKHQRLDVRVHEHRAPTDQSVAILREMEKAAEERVLMSARLENNAFRAEWKVVEEPYDMRATAICRFQLNGEEHAVKVDLGAMERSREAVAEKVLAAVQRCVAMQITLPLFMSASTKGRLAAALPAAR